MPGRSATTTAIGAAASLAALVAAFVPVWSLSQCATVDGRARALHAAVHEQATKRDLVVVGLPRKHPERSRGRLLFPFRPLFAVDADTLDADLRSLPFERVLAVGEVDPGRLGLGEADRVVDGVRTWDLDDPRRRLLSLVDYERVHVVDAVGAQPCRVPHPSGGVACGREPWFYVGPRVQRVDGRDRLCLWAHPPPAAARLAIGLSPVVKEPGGQVLRIDVHFTDEVRGDPPHEPVQVELREAGALLAAVSCTNQLGSCPLDHALAAGAHPALSLELSTPSNGRQLLCLGGGLLSSTGGAP